MKIPLTNPIYFLVVIFFSVLYAQSNIGGVGFWLPSNVVVWSTVLLFSLVFLIRNLTAGTLKLSWFTAILGLFLFLLLFLGSFHKGGQFEITHLVICYFVIVLFVLTLDQLELNQIDLDRLLLSLAVLGFLAVFISFIQLFDAYGVLYQLTGYEFFRISGRAVGFFQQPNMLASFLSFVVLAATHLLLKSPYKNIIKLNVIFVLTIGLSVYIILISGSRVGLLSLTLSVTLMLVFYGWQYRPTIVEMIKIFSAIGLGIVMFWFMPSDVSLVQALDTKMTKVLDGVDIRWYLYDASYNMVMSQPLWGVGLGNFPDHFIEYARQHEIYHYVGLDRQAYLHPHNELLYWAAESGLLPVLFLILAGLGLLVVSWKANRDRLIVSLLLALPFLIQAQVSFPFSLSAIHLFLFLLLLHFSMGRLKLVELSYAVLPSHKRSAVIAVGFGGFVALWLSIHTLKSIEEFYYFKNRLFLYQNEGFKHYETNGYFPRASSHFLFKGQALATMNSMLERAIRNHNFYDIMQYKRWADSLDYRDQSVQLNLRKATELLKSQSDNEEKNRGK